jgi:hypothetical protein
VGDSDCPADFGSDKTQVIPGTCVIWRSASASFISPGDGCFNVDKREFIEQFLPFRACRSFFQPFL